MTGFRFSPDFLNLEEVYFDVETKTIEPAGYKALVLWQEWLDVAAAEKILELTSEELPVVILGGAASYTPFNDAQDETLKAVMDELKAQPSVRVASVE